MIKLSIGGVTKGWNVILVSYEGEERRLLEELQGLGEFATAGFRSLLLGRVEDLSAFLQALSGRMPFSLSRAVPLEETFYSSPENLLEELKRRLEPLADRIEQGETFCIRFERRGFKGLISSKEMEHQLGDHLYHLLEQRGKSPKVNLEDPDKMITVQQLGNLIGIGLIDKELRQRYPFVRVK